jgi:hypothetical protein
MFPTSPILVHRVFGMCWSTLPLLLSRAGGVQLEDSFLNVITLQPRHVYCGHHGIVNRERALTFHFFWGGNDASGCGLSLGGLIA